MQLSMTLKVCLKDWHSDYDALLNSVNVSPPPPSYQEESIEALSVIYHPSRVLRVS